MTSQITMLTARTRPINRAANPNFFIAVFPLRRMKPLPNPLALLFDKKKNQPGHPRN